MIFLRRVERARRRDLGHDPGGKHLRRIQLRDHLFGRLLLGVVMIEDPRAVLRADVGPLPVLRRRVMGAEKDLEQFFVRHLLRVVFDLNRLGVTRLARADLLVGRVRIFPSDIAAGHRVHALDLGVDRLRAPETAAGKRRLGRLPVCPRCKATAHHHDRSCQKQPDSMCRHVRRLLEGFDDRFRLHSSPLAAAAYQSKQPLSWL